MEEAKERNDLMGRWGRDASGVEFSGRTYVTDGKDCLADERHKLFDDVITHMAETEGLGYLKYDEQEFLQKAIMRLYGWTREKIIVHRAFNMFLNWGDTHPGKAIEQMQAGFYQVLQA